MTAILFVITHFHTKWFVFFYGFVVGAEAVAVVVVNDTTSIFKTAKQNMPHNIKLPNFSAFVGFCCFNRR